jgi:hypothetical protein
MDSYDFRLMEKSQIGNASRFSQKMMLTVAWNPTAFAVVTAFRVDENATRAIM